MRYRQQNSENVGAECTMKMSYDVARRRVRCTRRNSADTTGVLLRAQCQSKATGHDCADKKENLSEPHPLSDSAEEAYGQGLFW